MRLTAELRALRSKGLHRRLRTLSRNGFRIRAGGRTFIDFSSNDYLGLGRRSETARAAANAALRFGSGSGASRLLSGTLTVHSLLESKLAAFKGEEACLVFGSGYLANLGAVTALVGDGDAVVLDRLCHASLVDAARLSGAKLLVYPHRDMAALDKILHRVEATRRVAPTYRRILVATDAYFSMDGDVAPLEKLVSVCRRRGAWLLVDEAHSTGVFGETGAGLTEHCALQGKIEVVMGTLSKAIGSVGGYIAGKKPLIEFLVNRARPFIFTTALPPSAAAAAIRAIELIEKEPGLRRTLWKRSTRVRRALKKAGFRLAPSTGPIVPVMFPGKKALKASEKLRERGIYAPAIRPPTVKEGTERIRLSLSAGHSEADIEALIAAFNKL